MPFHANTKSTLETFLHQRHIKFYTHWTNFGENLAPQEVIVPQIRNEKDLQDLIKLAAACSLSVKAAAGGDGWELLKQSEEKYRASFSRSGTALADIMVNLVGEAFEKIALVNKDKNLASVGPGIQMIHFVRYVDEHYNIVPLTTTLMPYVTWIGAAMIGGINTGNVPSLSDLTRAMKICNFKGEIEWLDAEREEDFDKIKQCMLGLYGIVLEMHVQCVPSFKMEYKSRVRSINDILWDLEHGLFTRSEQERISILHSPPYDLYGGTSYSFDEESILLMTWNPVSKTVRNKGVPTKLNLLLQEFEIGLTEAIDMGEIEEKHNQLVPLASKALRQAVFKEEDIVGPYADTVFNIHDYPHQIANTDMIFRAKLSSQDVAKVMRFVFDKLAEYAARKEYVLSYVFYLRSIGQVAPGSEASLSPTHHLSDEKAYSLDFVSRSKLKGYDAFIKEIYDYLSKPEFNLTFHWGKDIPSYVNIPKLLGTRLESALKVLSDFHQRRGGDFLQSVFMTDYYRNLFRLNSPRLTAVDGVRFHEEEKGNNTPRQPGTGLLPRLSLLGSANTASAHETEVLVEEPDEGNKNKTTKTSTSWCLPCFSRKS